MSLWTAIKARLEGQTAYAPAAIAAFAAAGITVNADGTVAMPDGTKGTFDPSTGIISLADGSDVALPNYDPSQGQAHSNPTTTGVLFDVSAWWREASAGVEGLTVGSVVGIAIGAGIGASLAGPIGARIGATVAGSLGAWIGWKVG